MKPQLTTEDFEAAARVLNCEVAAIRAVAQVESADAGFLSDDRVRLLFERHKFHRFTGGRYSAKHPDISNPKPGGYSKGKTLNDVGSEEYARFSRAFKLDPAAAMKSASWGKFQIMGFNHLAAGFQSVGEFVDAMKVSEGEHLMAFVNVIKAWGLADELRELEWLRFAAAYNGPAFRVNRYHTKMAAAYRRFKG